MNWTILGFNIAVFFSHCILQVLKKSYSGRNLQPLTEHKKIKRRFSRFLLEFVRSKKFLMEELWSKHKNVRFQKPKKKKKFDSPPNWTQLSLAAFQLASARNNWNPGNLWVILDKRAEKMFTIIRLILSVITNHVRFSRLQMFPYVWKNRSIQLAGEVKTISRKK